jgi:hypothetical protein
MLDSITIASWSSPQRVFVHLGQAIGHRKLPLLSDISLCSSTLASIDLRALVDGLQGHAHLRRLRLQDFAASRADIHYLGKALGGRGFGALEKLELDLYDEEDYWDPILDALVAGAPCSRTLRGLKIGGNAFSHDSVHGLLQRLGYGTFPRLTALELCFGEIDMRTARQLGLALLALVGTGTPSRLERLTLHADGISIAWLDDLTAVFEAGGMPDLVTLMVFGEGKAEVSHFLRAWTALGPKIRLERLDLGLPMLQHQQPHFFDALADPAFCPFLRTVTDVHEDMNHHDVLASLETRRRKRDALAAAAAAFQLTEAKTQVVKATAEREVEELRARLAALEARVAALEASSSQPAPQLQTLPSPSQASV